MPREDGAPRPVDLLYWAAFLALFAGVFEAVYLFAAFRLWHAWLPTTPQLVWMAPFANLVLFAPPALLLFGLARWRPGWIKPHVAAGVLAFLAAGVFALLFPQLHRLARVLLLVGVAVQAARVYRNRFPALRRAVTAAIPILCAIMVVLTVAVNVALHRGMITAGARPHARAGAPNVLLLILDTVRAQSLSLYGYSRNTTPELTQFALEGTRFDWAFATAPWTLPSHATMFTGRYPQEHGADWQNPLDDTYPTIAEILRDHGYETAGFVSNITYGSRQAGLNRGFLHYEDYPPIQILRSSALSRRLYTDSYLRRLVGYYDNAIRKRAPRINEDFLAWLEADRDPARPFFAFLNYFDAHEPYMPPEPFTEMFGSDSLRENHLVQFAPPFGIANRPWRSQLDSAELQAEVDAYDASIASIDHAIGTLFDELRQRDALDNTIVIVTSDHGEHLGEDGNFGHTATLREQVLRVPLLIYYPGTVPAGTVVGSPVTLRDLAATILDLTDVPDATAIPGSSLANFWARGGAAVRTSSPIIARVSRGVRARPSHGISSIIDSTVQYIRRDNDVESVFDLSTDTMEGFNLAGTPKGQAAIGRLRPALDRALAGMRHAAGARDEQRSVSSSVR